MKVWLKRLWKYAALPLVCAILGLFIGVVIYREVAQRDISTRRTIDSPNGIESLEAVSIGGVEQWLSIRGQDRSAPVLLYVHGGPGSPMMPLAHAFQDPIEDHFVVVQWDQRGAGKSRLGGDELQGVTFDRMVEDVLELTRHLRDRFQRDQIVLLGHSWGSLLGVHAMVRHPEYYSAYVGVGQVVSMPENETVTYRISLDQARKRGDLRGLAALEALAPYPDPNMVEYIRKIGIQRRWLMEYGGSIRVPGGAMTLVAQLFTAPEYSLGECFAYFPGSLASIKHFGPEFLSMDLRDLGTTFDVPVFVISGTYDYQVPFEIAEGWFMDVQAPYKEFLWVPEAAHMPMCSQPGVFAGLLEQRVLPLVKSRDMK